MSTNKDEIIDMINNVQHPEIANTLNELGMLDEIDLDVVVFRLNRAVCQIALKVVFHL